MEMAADLAVEAAKVVPATPVTVMSFLGYTVDQWASAATLVYVLGLIAHAVWRYIRRRLARKER